ncbi:hypothetical protein ACOMHN_014892 [Nucella lapillus]
MATVENEEVPLSPGAEEKLHFLLRAVRSGEAQLQEGKDGKLQIVYANENASYSLKIHIFVNRRIPLSHVDPSKANTIQVGGDANDVQARVDVCLEMIEAIKTDRAPSGVVLDKSKVAVSPLGLYQEGKQFERLEEVLGKGNCAGDIVVVRDNKTDAAHALKTVMISVFSPHEVRAWIDLNDSDCFPSLYLFRLDGNKIFFHMEIVQHGVTLDDIIDGHMTILRQNAPELARPFSLCMFHGLLSAVKEMHDKNYAHRDLHGGNVMLTKDSVMLKILDFGMARPLREGLNFNHDELKNDVLNAIRLFCGLYIGQNFENNFTLERDIKDGTIKKVLSETACLSREDREELLQLIMMTYQVTSDHQQAGYGSTSPVMEDIEHKLFPAKKMDIMRKAAAVLFPDFYTPPEVYSSPEVDGGKEVVDGAAVPGPFGDGAEEFDLEKAAKDIPDDFLEKLHIQL